MKFWGSTLGANIDENRSKHEVSLGRLLGIDLWKMFMDFRSQVGTENRAKTRQDKANTVRQG